MAVLSAPHGCHLPTLGVATKSHVFHDFGHALVVDGIETGLGVKSRGDSFRSVAAVKVIKDFGDPSAKNPVVAGPAFTAIGTIAPLIVGSPINVNYLAHPLDRVLGSVVINKLEGDHQSVVIEEYFMASCKISRTSRSLAFSFSDSRMQRRRKLPEPASLAA